MLEAVPRNDTFGLNVPSGLILAALYFNLSIDSC
jgi:hypothetical protein